MVVFEEKGSRSSRRKLLGSEKRTNKLNQHMTPDMGIEPGPHWWETSALTTAPSMHPNGKLCILSEPNRTIETEHPRLRI